MEVNHYDITEGDVGHNTFVDAIGCTRYPRLGTFLKQDIGKRLVRVDGVWQVENEVQLAKRRRKEMPAADRLALISNVYNWAVCWAPSLSDTAGGTSIVGADLAKLFAAIAHGEPLFLSSDSSLLYMLRESPFKLPPNHEVWTFAQPF